MTQPDGVAANVMHGAGEFGPLSLDGRLTGVNWLGEACPEQHRRDQREGLTEQPARQASQLPVRVRGVKISIAMIAEA